MKARKSLIGLSTAITALTLTACASSTISPPTPKSTPSIPPHLMIAPPPLPKLQRAIDDQGAEVMTGEQALNNIAMLYGAYGDVRATLITLQEVVKTAQALNAEKQTQDLIQAPSINTSFREKVHPPL